MNSVILYECRMLYEFFAAGLKSSFVFYCFCKCKEIVRLSYCYRFLFEMPIRNVISSGSYVFAFCKRLCQKVISLLTPVFLLFQQSVIIQSCEELGNHFLHYHVRIYGFFVIISCLVGIALSVFTKTMLPFSFLLLLIIGSLFFLWIPVSVHQLFSSSVIARSFFGFFGISFPYEKAKRPNETLFFVASFALGILLALKGMQGFFIFTAIFVLIVMMFQFKMALAACVFSACLLPTTFVFLLCLLCLFSFYRLIFQKKIIISFDRNDFFVSLFCVLYLLAGVFSFNPGHSLFLSVLFFVFAQLYFVMKYGIQKEEDFMQIVYIFVFSGCLISLYGLWQKLSGGAIIHDSWVDEKLFESVKVRVYSTLDNPNMLGEFLYFYIPLAVASMYTQKRFLYRLLSFGCALLGGICMLLTMSRGAWLGLCIGMFVFTLLCDQRLLLIIFPSFLILPLLLPSNILGRFLSIGNLGDSSAFYRMSIYRSSLQMAKHHAGSGIGLGFEAFKEIFQRYAYSSFYALHSHNLYLQIIIELSIFALILFFILLISTLRITLRKSRMSGKPRFIFAAFACGFIAFLIHGLVDNTWFNYRLILLFWMIMGLSQFSYNVKEVNH